MKSILTVVAVLMASLAYGGDAEDRQWPQRVVITNDDGIEERERLSSMAEAFITIAETYVVVPRHDRSGTTNYLTIGSRKRALEVELVYELPATETSKLLKVYVVDGYPADCVAFAILGLLKDNPPDLVVSGPNGGPNLGVGWAFSGTIGAARTAALLGVPALAISGVEDEWPEALAAVASYTVKLARSPLVRDMSPGQYLTVGLPEKMPAAIKGVRMARRAPPLMESSFVRGPELIPEDTREVWLLQRQSNPQPPPEGSDEDLWRQDFVVITPMQADEHDDSWYDDLSLNPELIPEWP
jgi:5'-nucleotidase